MPPIKVKNFNFFTKFVIFCFFTFFITSCEKPTFDDKETQLPSNYKSFSSSKLRKDIDIQAYESIKVFQDQYYLLANSSKKKLEFSKKTHSNNFISLKDYYDSVSESDISKIFKQIDKAEKSIYYYLIERDGNLTLERVVDNSTLQLMLNNNMQIIIGNELLTFGFTEIKVENLENGKKETKKIKRSNFEFSKKAKVNEYSYYEDYYESGGKDYKYFFKMVHNSYGNYLNTACPSITHYKKSWGFYWQHDTYWMNINANYVGGGCYGSSLPYNISVIEEDFICSNIEIDLLTGSAQCAANVDVYFTLTIKTGGIINWNWSS